MTSIPKLIISQNKTNPNSHILSFLSVRLLQPTTSAHDSVSLSHKSSSQLSQAQCLVSPQVSKTSNPESIASSPAIWEKPMKGGRKNLKRAAEEQSLTLLDGQSIMQVVSLRGSNLIEVLDAKGEKSLALFPAKFQKSMWIKRGSFVVVDESGKEKAIKDGSKVACIVTKVLFYEQVRALQKSTEWPEIFKSANSDDANGSLERRASNHEEIDQSDSDDDDGLPPLEANTNRTKRMEFQTESESDSESDTYS